MTPRPPVGPRRGPGRGPRSKSASGCLRRVHGRREGDGGAATVWAAGAVAVLLVVLVAGLHLGSAVVARHRAESAADLAALAAAAHAIEGEERACAAARVIAGRDGASLLSCRLDGWDALVEARAPLPFALPGAGDASGRARAGPAP